MSHRQRTDVLTLTVADVDQWRATPLHNELVAVVVPGECRDRFYDSPAWVALAPCLRDGVIVFFGPGRRVDVVAASLRWATLEVAGDRRGVYLRSRSPQYDVPVAHTVEALIGRVFVDVDGDERLLGVEVLT
jgi:hypothetical protein